MKKSRFSSKGKEGKEPKTGDFDSNAIDDPQPSTSRFKFDPLDLSPPFMKVIYLVIHTKGEIY